MKSTDTSNKINKLLIAGISPYFLDKENFWFEKNLAKILAARKTQSFFEDNTIFLEKGKSCHLSEFLRKLDEMGYEKVLEVTNLGEFAKIGGVIDLFPISSNKACRIEFYGNYIENIEELPFVEQDEGVGKEVLKRRLKSQKIFSDMKNIKGGDYLVHLDHGVARFAGIDKNYYILEYAQGDKLYIPLGLERKLSRYVGFAEPKISRLSSPLWQKTKRRIREGAEKLAKELLEVYAKRETASRLPYEGDQILEKEIASSFIYEETPDQLQVLADIKRDLDKSEPMDRVVCGDVGFGKTEIALRTMVRAASSGRQSALICPTTILANQHFQNFNRRLAGLPIKVELLCRLQTKKKQREIVEKLKLGDIDIIIGTHRLLSKDVEGGLGGGWNLGLLVIDDEQRFGVKQKEKLKKMRAEIDVLSLSATPIPRTLYLALSSLKPMSVIQTPPEGRLAIKTAICLWSEKTIKEAMEKELERKGQVYYLHNRVETIGAAKKLLIELLPEARVEVAHGQMPETDLISVMKDFEEKKVDVLVATTIIENGIDLPNVNTLIVADAAKLGLSEAYQIKGRVGRSNLLAFSYFLHGKKLSAKAKQRLSALKEAEELGSGYRIALRDLEIRGAGNILGREQSGNINQVGLNLYCQMLSEAVEKLKNSPPST